MKFDFKFNFMHATALVLVLFLVVNLIGLAMGRIPMTTFWINIAVVWMVSFLIMKKMKGR